MKVDPVTLLQMVDHRINIQPVIAGWLYVYCLKVSVGCASKHINICAMHGRFLDNSKGFVGEMGRRYGIRDAGYAMRDASLHYCTVAFIQNNTSL